MITSVALLLALAAAQPPPSVIERPDWIEKPSGADVDYHYPARAIDEDKAGTVKLRCLVQETGYVTGCEVVDEDPPGYQFGAAALGLSTKFRMKPMTADGRPVGGAIVMIPIRFEPSEADDRGTPFAGMPDLETALVCYGHYAAKAEREPNNKDVRAHATVYAAAVIFGADLAGLSPSKVEASLTEARKAGNPDRAPEQCEFVPGAAEQLGIGGD